MLVMAEVYLLRDLGPLGLLQVPAQTQKVESSYKMLTENSTKLQTERNGIKGS